MTQENEFQVVYSKIIGIAWLVIFVGAAIISVVGLIFNPNTWYYWTISYILGAMVNVFAFNLLRNHVQSLTSDAKSGIRGSYTNYILRFGMYGLITYFAFLNDKLNPYFVIPGFITIRLAIYIYSIKNKNK